MRNHLAQQVRGRSAAWMLARCRWFLTILCGLYVLAFILSLMQDEQMLTLAETAPAPFFRPMFDVLWPPELMFAMVLILSIVMMLMAWREWKHEKEH